MTDAKIAAQVEQDVLRRVEADDLIFPALPAVAAKTLAILSRADFSLAEVGRLVETDPILAARLVKITNSAAFAGRQRVTSITECCTRLGSSELRLFLLETSARRILESNDKRIAQICRGVWEHSLAVALLARDLLGKVYLELSEAAYLAGLLHDIGKPVLAAMFLDSERKVAKTKSTATMLPETWLHLITRTHRRVGVALAERWGLPESVWKSIRRCDAYDPSEPRAVPNAVRFANALTKGNGIYEGVVDRSEVEILIFQGREIFSIGDVALEQLVGSLKSRVAGRLG